MRREELGERAAMQQRRCGGGGANAAAARETKKPLQHGAASGAAKKARSAKWWRCRCCCLAAAAAVAVAVAAADGWSGSATSTTTNWAYKPRISRAASTLYYAVIPSVRGAPAGVAAFGSLLTVRRCVRASLLAELDKVRKLCERQELPLQYRPRVWSVLLGVLPPFPESWEFVSEQHKQQYDDTKRAALLLSTCSGAGASRLASHSVSDEAADLADDAHHQRDDEQEQIDLVSDASHSDGDSVVLSDGASSSIGRFDEDILPTTPPHSGSDKQHHAKPSRPTHHHHHHHHQQQQQQQQQQDTTQALAHPLAPQQQQQQQLSTLLQLSESISSSSSGSSASSASSSASLTSCTTLVPSIVLSQVTKRNRLLALIYNASKLLDTRHKVRLLTSLLPPQRLMPAYVRWRVTSRLMSL